MNHKVLNDKECDALNFCTYILISTHAKKDALKIDFQSDHWENTGARSP